MRVLHILQSSRFSGAENVACQIIGLCASDGVESVYASRNGQIREALADRGVAFAPIKKLSVAEVRRVIRKVKPDLIHAHDMRASTVAAMAAGRIPVVAHIHNSDYRARRVSIKSLSFLLCAPRFAHILWVSRSCADSYVFARRVAGKSTVLYNIVDAEAIRRRADEHPHPGYDIVYIGRLADPKNPARLIRILSRIHDRKPDLRVGIVGSGDLEVATREAVRVAELDDSVVFHGFLSEPLGILKASKIMVMTSDREGVPMAALEAMALGVPIVSTPTDGLCDTVRPGVTGYLDWDEAAFADKALRLIIDPAERARFSEAIKTEFAGLNDPVHYREVLYEVYGKR